MASLIHMLTVALIRMTGAKRVFSDPERVRQKIAAAAIRPGSFAPPKRIPPGITIDVSYETGWPVYRIARQGSTTAAHGIYVHGGAWINEILAPQWRFIIDLVDRTGASITVPIYPLAPRGTASTVVPRIAGMLAAAIETFGAGPVFAIGDSAGGQILLSAALLLRDRGQAAAAQMILISPALDLRMTNPDADDVEVIDPWLSRAGMTVAIDMWRGERPVDDELVSPLVADLHGLGPLTVFSGTRDITNPDTRLLVEKVRAAGGTIQYHEERGLIHVYPLLFGPEARAARTRIVQIVKRLG